MELPKALATSVNSPDPFSPRGVVAPAPTHEDHPGRCWGDRSQRAPYRTDHRTVRERERGQSKFALRTGRPDQCLYAEPTTELNSLQTLSCQSFVHDVLIVTGIRIEPFASVA